MSNTVPDPLTTHRLFEHDRVAAGYASARPFLHGEVFALLGKPGRNVEMGIWVCIGVLRHEEVVEAIGSNQVPDRTELVELGA